MKRRISAPTFPIYDKDNFPQDAIEGQLAITTDDLLCWFSNGSWSMVLGSTVPSGNAPQDSVEGQAAIGSDDSFCWYSNGSWHCVAPDVVSGNPPQDAIEGQIVLGSDDSICWFSSGEWHGLNSSSGGSGVTYIASFLFATHNLVHIIPDTTYFIEQHFVGSTSRDLYLNGSLVLSEGPSGFSADDPSFVFDLGFVPIGVDYPNFIYYLWDLKLGTSRGASDLFADPLSTVPTSTNYDIGSSLGISTDTLVGIGSVVQMQAIWDSSVSSYAGFALKNIFGISSQTDMWTSFNIQFPPSTKSQLESPLDNWRDSIIQIAFLSRYLFNLACDTV